MERGQGCACRAAMVCARTVEGKPVEKCQERGRVLLQYRRLCPLAGAQRLGAGDPLAGKMFEKAQEKRQIVRAHTLFVQRKNEGGAIRLKKKIGILDTFGNTLETPGRAYVIGRQHGAEFIEADISMNGHGRSGSLGSPSFQQGEAWLRSCLAFIRESTCAFGKVKKGSHGRPGIPLQPSFHETLVSNIRGCGNDSGSLA